jgi:hypothetical protein
LPVFDLGFGRCAKTTSKILSRISGGLAGAYSSDQIPVGQPLACRRINETGEPLRRVPSHITLVEAEGELIDVPTDMLWADKMKGAIDASLENGKHALNPIRGYVVANELGRAVVDGFVSIPSEAAIGRELIGMQPRSRFDVKPVMQLQLNVHRLVVVYRVPSKYALDANTLAGRFDRWPLGADHAGWKFGWRDAPVAGDPARRCVETYCYAFAGRDLLEGETQQLYWRTDIVQMTRYFMIEAAHSGIRLSPRHSGFPL